MVSMEEMNRIRWAARRGMLELDLVLEPFVLARFAGLPQLDRQRFRALMACEDQDLYAWLLGRERPQDGELDAIVTQIRQFHRTAPEDR